jgi:hypothetical protein
MTIETLGIDIAKNVFQLHSSRGLGSKRVTRERLTQLMLPEAAANSAISRKMSANSVLGTATSAI